MGKSQIIRDFSFCQPFQILLIYWITQGVCSRFSRYKGNVGGQQFRGLVMSETHRHISHSTNLSFHLLEVIADHCRNLGHARKIEMLRNSSDLSLTIPDDQGYLGFGVFISWQNLGWSGNSKIPHCLGFS